MSYAAGKRPSPAQLKKLLRTFSEQLRAKPEDLMLRLKLAEVLRLLSRNNEAISLYSSVAWSHAVAGNLVQAIMLCKLILELSPAHRETQQMLAKLYASKRIREEKQAVPVQQVEGRWVADPRARTPAPTPSPLAQSAPPEQPTGAAQRVVGETSPPRPRDPAAAARAAGAAADLAEQAAAARRAALAETAIAPAEAEPSPSSAQPSAADLNAPLPALDHDGDDDLLADEADVETAVEVPSGKIAQARRPSPAAAPDVAPPRPQHPVLDPAPLVTGPIKPVSASSSRPLARGASQETEIESDEEDVEQNRSTTLHAPAPREPQPEPEPLLDEELPPTYVGPDKSEKEDQQGGLKRRETLRLHPGVLEGKSSRAPAFSVEPPPPAPGPDAPGPARPAPALSAEQRRRADADTTALPSVSVEAPPVQPDERPPATPLASEVPDGSETTALPAFSVEAPPLDPDDLPPATPLPGDVPPGNATTRLPSLTVDAPDYAPADRPQLQDGAPTAALPSVSATPPPVVAEEPPPSAAAAGEEDGEPEQRRGGRPLRDTLTGLPPIVTGPQQPITALPSNVPLTAAAEEDDAARDAEEALPTAVEPPPTAAAGEDGAVQGWEDTEDALPTAVEPPPAELAAADKASRPVLLEPDGDAEEQLPPAPRPQRTTAPMNTAEISTLLRRDAEIAYREAKPTESYAQIQREVLAAGHDLEEDAADSADDARAEQDLHDTLQQISDQEPPVAALPESHETPVIPLFSDLDNAAFVSLVDRLEARVYEPDELVIVEGDPGDSLMIVAAGHLQVLKRDDGRQLELAQLGPGAFFGEFGLLTDHRRHASVRSLDSCEILELRKEVLADLIRDHPSVQRTLRQFYDARVIEMVLATSSLFQAVSPEERERVVSRFSVRRFIGGQTIVEEGTHADAFYVLLLGEAAVTCRTRDGDVEVGRLSEGDYFGEMSLISGYPAEATVRATRVTELLMLDSRDFYDLASAHPEIWVEVQRESQARAAANDRILAQRKASALLL